jgi:D-alanyl-D-alanine carboxypeptidase
MPCGPASPPQHASRPIAAWLGALLLALTLHTAAHAQIGSARYSSIVIEADSGRILSAVSADELRHPASLTKMMTLYMVFEALRDRRITLQQLVPVSPHAASVSPSKLGLMPGTRITVHEAILGLVTKSANDAAAALGEMLGVEEGRFAQMMTLRARALGMSRSTFRNASGLPDPDQWTTARDMATLGRRLAHDFPAEYRYFATPSFRFHGRVILTHDHLLETYPGADGIKTGYTEASGFNLVSSAVRGGVRIVGVVLGAAHSPERDLHMIALLNQAFGQLDIGGPSAPGRPRGLVGAAQAAPLPPRPAARWAIQAGAFTTEAAARQAAATARRVANAGEPRVETITQQRKTLYRAQVIGLSEAEARTTCAGLARQRLPCATIRLDPQQLASR